MRARLLLCRCVTDDHQSSACLPRLLCALLPSSQQETPKAAVLTGKQLSADDDVLVALLDGTSAADQHWLVEGEQQERPRGTEGSASAAAGEASQPASSSGNSEAKKWQRAMPAAAAALPEPDPLSWLAASASPDDSCWLCAPPAEALAAAGRTCRAVHVDNIQPAAVDKTATLSLTVTPIASREARPRGTARPSVPPRAARRPATLPDKGQPWVPHRHMGAGPMTAGSSDWSIKARHDERRADGAAATAGSGLKRTASDASSVSSTASATTSGSRIPAPLAAKTPTPAAGKLAHSRLRQLAQRSVAQQR